jgi:exoribonuclease-2
VPGLDADLRRQDHLAQRLREMRHQVGALDFETIETEPIFSGDELARLDLERRGRAKELIEEFMVAANGVGARFLATHNVPSIRRVVRTPRRWEMIVELAAEHGARLPGEPDSKALEKFLVTERDKDPLRYPDLSLSVIKLMGAGEYVVEVPGQPAAGHFGLAVKDYAHSTAPNRRYPDVLTQRLLKSVLTGARVPYDNDELSGLAQHCTEAEDAAKKVERQVQKAAAALLLQSRVGEKFEALVTGASEKGTWVRILHPPVEGKLISGFQGVKVGQRLHVQLVHTNAERGYIDFRRS